jgi:hypothetical protein
MANVVKVFAYTGAAQSFVVPDQVTQVTIECWGGWGGGTEMGSQLGGAPEYTKGTITVTPGDTYYVYVGGVGADPTFSTSASAGGWNGGGPGGGSYQGGSSPRYQGGGGGGATDIRHDGTALSFRIMVAGGGGGMGGESNFTTTIRNQATATTFPTTPYPPYASDPVWTYYYSSGGGIGGFVEHAGGANGNAVAGGGAATVSAGGTGGAAGSGCTAGTAGTSGVGGTGGAATVAGGNGGGGGGGGYFGGGGAGGSFAIGSNPDFGGGGGGGSGYLDPGFTSTFSTKPAARGITSTNAPAGSQNGKGAAAFSYVQPPTVPSPTISTANTGTAGQYDVSQPLEFDWTFGSLVAGETQSRFDIRYSSDGGTTWTTITQVGNTNHFYIFAGGFFTAATSYQVQARVYDQEAVASNWSSSVSFTMVALIGAPTITAPTAGSTITTSPFTVSWTIPSGTQNNYQVTISDTSGHLLLDTGTVASATHSYSASVTPPNSENVIVSVRYQTTTSGGAWSSWASVTAFMNINPPAVPVVVFTPDSANGKVTLAITNPFSANGTAYNDVFRTDVTNSGPEIRIGTQIPVNGTFVDYTPGSGILYAYKVRAYSSYMGQADAT